MTRWIHPCAGQPAPDAELIDVATLERHYHNDKPDPSVAAERVKFGTPGHRGAAARRSFSEDHVVAIAQAICDYRVAHDIDGPLFVGRDTHALSEPAFHNSVEVFAANGVEVLVDKDWAFTPTPAVSHAILGYNKNRKSGRAEGICITPSHNPPDEGGLKYNPDHGGPADTAVTRWVENRANGILEEKLAAVKRMTLEAAKASGHLREHDYVGAYVADLESVVDMTAIRDAKVRIGVDPLGGAPIHYWAPIIERYGLNATVFNDRYDPRFPFVMRDWDGKIRMDCSSAYAMAGLLKLADRFDVAIATDTDADRHGIVCPGHGLMNASHYYAAMVAWLVTSRDRWPTTSAVAKTVVSSGMIDKVVAHYGRRCLEFPVGFKWFGPLLAEGTVLMAGEESAGASLLRRDGTVWTTDKDGIVPGLIAAETTARTGKNPFEYYREVTRDIGVSFYDRIDSAATPEIQKKLQAFPAQLLVGKALGGEPIETAIDKAPANNEPFGGFKVTTKSGWFAVRPSGTEAVYKIYAESFVSAEHLSDVQRDAQAMVEAG